MLKGSVHSISLDFFHKSTLSWVNTTHGIIDDSTEKKGPTAVLPTLIDDSTSSILSFSLSSLNHHSHTTYNLICVKCNCGIVPGFDITMVGAKLSGSSRLVKSKRIWLIMIETSLGHSGSHSDSAGIALLSALGLAMCWTWYDTSSKKMIQNTLLQQISMNEVTIKNYCKMVVY